MILQKNQNLFYRIILVSLIAQGLPILTKNKATHFFNIFLTALRRVADFVWL